VFLRPAGIKAVAAHAGVSVGTVSNVLNRPDQVAAATRSKVEKAMRELGFVRNRSAGALKAGRSQSVGLVVLDIGNPFFTEVARGVEQAASERGYAVLLCNSDESRGRQDTHLTFLEEQRVGGVLVTPVDADLGHIEQLRSRGTPVVLLDEPGQDGRCSVAVDDVRGGEVAGEHLLGLQRTRIAYVTGPDTIRQCVDRGIGLERAVAAAGLDPASVVRRVEVPALNGEEGHKAVDHILADGWPDAVFCANDVVALGVLRGLLEAGVSVPDDVSLVGYDDIEFAATSAVPLTSVRQPALQIGRTAAALLLEEIEQPDGHAHQQVMFRPELAARRSTGS
jgi:LacI family transcriptional regulator